MAQLQLTATQQVEVAVKATDARGNPAQLQNPVFASTDETVLMLADVNPPDGLKKVARAVGPVGPAMITFTGDADLGDGVVPVIGTLDVVVIAGQAVAIEISAGTPTEQSTDPTATPVRRR